jgi:27-O-demethylrifamycin SV methyltransferase
VSDIDHEPGAHYDAVTAAWGLLLGDDLHYGVFDTGGEPLPAATAALTTLMVSAAQLEPGLDVLDVGCGSGTPACHLASAFDVRVVGITTSAVGVSVARERAEAAGLTRTVSFELRDGTDNGFPGQTFDRTWVLESSHLMRDRRRLIDECARVLRPNGRFVLCDIIRRRDIPFLEVRDRREAFQILRAVFGDAHMESLDVYSALATDAGLAVDSVEDLTQATLPTFDRWRANARTYKSEVVSLLGAGGLDDFVRSCDILEAFWQDGTFGYGLISATMGA